MKEAENGQEVALAIKGVTIGRQVDEEDILLVDIPSSHASKLQQMDLSASENQILQELIEIQKLLQEYQLLILLQLLLQRYHTN